jgi:hypothetical protein
MMRIAILVALSALMYFCTGCRSAERVSYSVESTSRTSVNPWDDKLVDKIDLSITIRKSW